MNGTEAAFSYTLKTPAGNLVTVRGDDYDEFFNNLHALANDTEIVGVLGTLQSSVGHANAVSVDQGPARRASNPPRTQQRSQPDYDDNGTDGDGEYCKHGQMQYKSGTSKAGKAYSGFFCPDNDKMCKPVWSN